MKASVLVVDDDEPVRISLSEALGRDGVDVRTVESAEAALNRLGTHPADVVLTDVRMPGMNGLKLLTLLRDRVPEVDVVLMSAYEDLPTVSAAMRDGAVDFLVKPLDLHRVRDVLRRVFDDRRRRRAQEGSYDDEVEGVDHEGPRLIGHHPQMIEVFKSIGLAASNRAPVLIRGESGTGKELVARSIHNTSRLASEPFLALNCAALPEPLLESELFGHVEGAFTGASRDRPGRFATAGRGTILLDEIGDTTANFQTRLLRVLQEGEYFALGSDRARRTEARMIAATHRDLEARVASGDFRQDLYYRLRVLEIELPPLRERAEDIPELARHLVARASAEFGRDPPVMTEEALASLMAHRWPGNVRELENCVARAVVAATGSVLRPEHLSFGQGDEEAEHPGTLEQVECDHLARILQLTGGHKTRSAELLDVSRPRLDRLIQKYGLEALAPGRGGPTDET